MKWLMAIITAFVKGLFLGKWEVKEKSHEQIEVDRDDDKYSEFDDFDRM